MRKITMIVAMSFLLFNIFSISLIVERCDAAGSTLHVGSGQTYSTIQDAIDAANENDTIYVHSGTYNENIIIDEALILTGEDRDSTIIMGVSENDITLTIKGNFLEYVSNVRVSGLQILQNPTAISNEFACMYIEYARGCTITDSIIKDSYNGIRMKQTDESTISENTIENNDGDGILLFIYSDKNEIKNNLIQNNKVGIYLQDFCTENTIATNDISGNSNYGILIMGSSNNNIIYHNNFENNNNANDECSNTWYYSSEGNYWNDYAGSDPDGDGKGDTPYNIPGSGNQDLYPLGYFSGSNLQPIATIQSISPNPAIEGQTVSFNGYGTDYDGSIVAWDWKVDGVTVASTEDFSSSGFSVGTHSVTFRVQDNDDNWSPPVERTLVINPPNQIPTAYILDPTTAVIKYYGEDITFLGDWSDDGEVVEFSWRSDVDGNLSESLQFTKNDLKVEQHTIYFKVRDNYGEWSSEASIAVTILSDPSNNPPIADADGPYTGYVNQNVTFNGSNSYDPDDGDDITSYQWDFGDGLTSEGVSPDHTYTSEGNYTVELTVTDGHGEQNKNTTYANIGIHSNGQNGNAEEDDGFPGFELIFVIIASVIILFWIKKRKGS